MFKTPVRYANRNAKKPIVYIHVEHRKEVWTRDSSLGVTSTVVVIKAKGMDKLT